MVASPSGHHGITLRASGSSMALSAAAAGGSADARGPEDPTNTTASQLFGGGGRLRARSASNHHHGGGGGAPAITRPTPLPLIPYGTAVGYDQEAAMHVPPYQPKRSPNGHHGASALHEEDEDGMGMDGRKYTRLGGSGDKPMPARMYAQLNRFRAQWATNPAGILKTVCWVQFAIILLGVVVPALRGTSMRCSTNGVDAGLAGTAERRTLASSRVMRPLAAEEPSVAIPKAGDTAMLAAAAAMSAGRLGDLPPIHQHDGDATNATAFQLAEEHLWKALSPALQATMSDHAKRLAAELAETVPPNRMLAKLFDGALKPSTVKPYFFPAEQLPAPIDGVDIALTTMVTPDRIGRISQLAAQYPGPLSIAVHIPLSMARTPGTVASAAGSDPAAEALAQLAALRAADANVRQRVDLHLVVDAHPRQLNYWRNVARFFARAPLVLQLDADFDVSRDLRAHLLGSPDLRAPLLSGKRAYVLPAFEAVERDPMTGKNKPASEATMARRAPITSKADLVAAVKRGEVAMFHADWWPGHGPTDYPQWYNVTVSPVLGGEAAAQQRAARVYAVPRAKYSVHYEPYVVMRQDAVSWCDERFVGYGANKAACLYELWLAGTEFAVLPDDWVMHMNHAYPEETRANERRYNQHLYSTFRAEQCVRYMRMRTAEHGLSGVSDAELQTFENQCRAIVSQKRTHPGDA